MSKANTVVGETYTALGFADFGLYQRTGQVEVARDATIDVNSTWATQQMNKLIKDNPTIFTYFGNAGTNGDYDFKSRTPDHKSYYGSLLFGKFASARDVGNLGAGLVAQRSVLPNNVYDYGYGRYNETHNSKITTIYSIWDDLDGIFIPDGTDRPDQTLESMKTTIKSGEDKLTQEGIEEGKALFKTLKSNGTIK